MFLASLLLCLPIEEASVRVNPKSPSSGTVVKVQKEKSYYKVWILSTGHFQNKVNEKIDVEFFYLNDKKLLKPRLVTGKVIYKIEENFTKGVDFSVLELKMRNRPISVPIAKRVPRKNTICQTIGCDLGSEPTLTTTKIIGKSLKDFKTVGNDPRAGRSGGGLFLNGELVGVCWGSSPHWGYYTSNKQIIKYLKKNGLTFLLR